MYEADLEDEEVAGVYPQRCRAGEKLHARSTCWQQPCARARAAAQQGAVGKRTAKLCGSSDVEADVQERLDVGLHAVMLVLRAQ